jgi:hypothetical protein
MTGRALAVGALILACASGGLSACSAAATAVLGVALNIGVKATELDTAIIENIKARKNRQPPPADAAPTVETRP